MKGIYLTLLSLFFVVITKGQQTMLDDTFGKHGKVISDSSNPSNIATSVIILTDGSILTGTGPVAKYLGNGIVDLNFGTNGFTQTIPGGASLLIQTDGKIISTGHAWNNGNFYNFSLERLNANGTIDSTFNGIGYRIDVIRGQDECHTALLQPNGKIVLGGDTNYYPAFARYNPDGSFDSSFGANGKLVDYRLGRHAEIYSVLLQPDGKIVAIGNVYNVLGPPPPPPMKNDFLVLRYNSNGTPDSSFGIGGIVITDLGNGNGEYDFAYAGALQPDGKILAAGSTEPIGGHFAMARYLPNGNLDCSFGDDRNGVVITDVTRAGASDIARSMTLQSNGKIVLAGRSRNATNTFAVARYLPNGSLDSAWGNDGTVNTDIGGYRDEIGAIAIQPDDKIVAVGSITDSIDHYTVHTALVRYLDQPSTAVSGIVKTASDFKVYPNPTKGSFTLFSSNSKGNAAITVTDILGKTIITQTNNFSLHPKLILDLSGYANGTYFVNIQGNQSKVTLLKLLKD